MCWGGGGQEDVSSGDLFYPLIYPPTEFMPSSDYGANNLLGEQTAGGGSPGPVPTGGWTGSGSAGYIPGAAQQLLASSKVLRRSSPQYLWR